MALPVFQTNIRELSMLGTQWKAQIDPLLALPTSSPAILKNISLTTGENVINHKLGRTPQGWIIVDTNAAVNAFRSQPFNNLTLTLNSSANATVTLMVF